MQNVRIIKGLLSSGEVVENITLTTESIIQARGPFNCHYYGSFDTRGTTIKQRANLRILFQSSNDFEILNGGAPVSHKDVKKGSETENNVMFIEETPKTDKEIYDEISEKFSVLDLITKAVSENKIRSLVVSGSPGTGKSFGVERIMMEKSVKDHTFYYTLIKGSITPVMLYCTLWECRSKNSVLVLDDCDVIFEDVETLNMLKAASDSSRTRKICYTKLTSYLAENDIPQSFEFEGGLVFLSNINFVGETQKKSKLLPHIAAFVSRAHYIDVSLNTNREKMIRLMIVAKSEAFEKEHKVSKKQVENCCEWITNNMDIIRELSLRTLSKIIDLLKTFPNDWERIAKITLCM